MPPCNAASRNGGWIQAQWTVRYGAVIVIFLLSGMSLKSKVLVQALGRAHLHLLIQVGAPSPASVCVELG